MSHRPPGWWLTLVACPACGADIHDSLSKASPAEGRCLRCGRRFELCNNVLAWSEGPGESAPTDRPTPAVLRKLKNAINPLNNPLLPMWHLTRVRREAYYRRTLTDASLARSWADHFLTGFDLGPDAVALDFGCGRGRNTALLAQLGFNVVAQDIQMHPWWQSMPAAGFQTARNGRLPWKDNSFDLFVGTEVIHYLSPQALETHVGEVLRVLRPGAHWLMLEANAAGRGARHIRKQIGRLHSLGDVRQLVSAHGFTECDCSFEGYYTRWLPGLVNFLRKQCSLRPLDLYDWNSRLAARIPPEERGLWLLRLQKPLH